MVELDCFHGMPCLKVHTVGGEGKHFVSFKPTQVEVARFHPGPPELGARLKMNVINNFGAKAITLDYKKKTQVTIGPETISFESFEFNHGAKKIRTNRQGRRPRANGCKTARRVAEYVIFDDGIIIQA